MPWELAKQVLKVLCPYLKDMASRTNNKVDDWIVRVICSIAESDD